MEAKNGFFAESVEEGLERIRKVTGRRVADTGFRGKRRDTRYFVTDDGQGFLCKRMHGRLFFREKSHGVRPGRRVHYFSIGCKRTKQSVPVKKCVYCAFVLGRWDEDCEVVVKDGDEGHLEVGNLAAKENKTGTPAAEILARHADVYRKEFRRFVGILEFRFALRKEVCEDIVQDAFLYACNRESEPQDFTALWMWKAQLECKKMFRHPEKEWDECLEATHDTPFEYSLGSFLSLRGLCYEFWNALHGGWHGAELMEHLKISREQYKGCKKYIKQKLKRALRNDIYFMDHRCEII